MSAHPHKDVIIAFANGEVIQYRASECHTWKDWSLQSAPTFDSDVFYRVKPKPDIVKHLWLGSFPAHLWESPGYYRDYSNVLEVTFDGETGDIKHARKV